MMYTIKAIFIICLTLTNSLFSKVITVPKDYSSIQEAIDSAVNYDIIKVLPGQYTEHITITKKITVKGQESHSTIIDGNQALFVVEITDGKLQGFTIKNGKMGIYIPSGVPIISNCLLTGNEYNGIRTLYYGPAIANQTIEVRALKAESNRALYTDELREKNTLSVEMSQFSGRHINGSVLLYWETQSETKNLGWNIYESTSYEGHFIKRNDSLIPGNGNSAYPQKYIFQLSATNDRHKSYYLEQINTDGQRNYTRIINVSGGNSSAYVNISDYGVENVKAFQPYSKRPSYRNTIIPSARADMYINYLKGKRVRTITGSHPKT